MRQSSGQNMHGQWLRTLSRLCLAAVSALKESSHFIDFSILHCPRRVIISVSAYHIRDYQRICFVARISEIAPRVYYNSSERDKGDRARGIVVYEYKSRFNLHYYSWA